MSERAGIMKRLLAAAFFTDAGFFLLLGAVPYKVLQLGGGPVALGLIPAVSSLCYVVLAFYGGKISDRVGRYRMTRFGNLTLIVFSCLAYASPSLTRLALCMPLLGLGAALFWPAVQAAVGDLSEGRGALERHAGRLNVSWCSGKAIGYFTGGMLLAHYDFKTAFLSVIGFMALSILSLPREERISDEFRQSHRGAARREPDAGTAPEADVPLALRATFRRMAWLANFAAYGATGIMNHQMPKLYQELGWPESRFGLFLGLIFGAQALAFLLLSTRMRLSYSAGRLIVPQALAAAAILAIPFATRYPVALLLTPVLGISFGICYQASIFYSLHTDAGKGRNAGIHESLIGAAGFLMPALGGFGVLLSGWIGAPYLIAGAVILAAVGVQLFWWRGSLRAS